MQGKEGRSPVLSRYVRTVCVDTSMRSQYLTNESLKRACKNNGRGRSRSGISETANEQQACD